MRPATAARICRGGAELDLTDVAAAQLAAQKESANDA
jgi:hypothetical protein